MMPATSNGIDPRTDYDESSDSLYITFAPGRGATGIELNGNVLLRLDTAAREPVGLTIFNFSVLSPRTDMGPRSFPLTGLENLDHETRSMVLLLLLDSPVADYLAVSAYTPANSPGHPIPIPSLQAGRMLWQA